MDESHDDILARRIKLVCAAEFGVTVEAMDSVSMSRRVIDARAVAIYLIRDRIRFGFVKIAATMGVKSHSGVIRALDRVIASLFLQIRAKSAAAMLDDLNSRISGEQESNL